MEPNVNGGVECGWWCGAESRGWRGQISRYWILAGVVTSGGRCANIANVTRVKETVLVAAEHNGAVEHSEGGN